MTVISSRELERMRASVRPEAATATDSRRLLLKGLSDEKVKTWPNTLEAMRKKKENWKKEKIEEEEKARVEMDKEEAAFQMKQRLGAIERANLLLYEQTDRMKGLRSKQTYSEVVRERKEQAKEKQLRKRWESEKEREYHEALLKQIDQAERRDAGAEAARRAKAEAIADAQRAQLGEFRAKHIERLEAAKKDGELILKRAIADHEEDERLLEERRVASKIQQRMTLLANEALEERKREQRKEEERAEKARHADVAKKEYVASERERLEKARFDARQATKQRLIDKASNELATRINRDAERLERQVEELRQKEENLAALKVEMIRKQKAAIDASRREQLEAKQRRSEEDKRSVEVMVAQWKVKNQEIEEEQAAEALAKHRENKLIREAQEEQIKATRLAKTRARAERLAFDRDAQSAMREEDERFRATARLEIERAEAAGKPTYMLYKAVTAKERDLVPATGLRL